MIVELGKCYQTRDGQTVGPAIRLNTGTRFRFKLSGWVYRDDGRFWGDGREDGRDLVSEERPGE
jgi:hypothetical protein